MRFFIMLMVAVGLLAGCPSKQDKLVSLRTEKRATLDALFAEFGGGELAAQSKQKAGEQAKPDDGFGKALVQALGNAVGEADRLVFEDHCQTLGGGERPTILTDKAKAYFGREDVQKKCRKVAALALEVSALERELGVPPQK